MKKLPKNWYVDLGTGWPVREGQEFLDWFKKNFDPSVSQFNYCGFIDWRYFTGQHHSINLNDDAIKIDYWGWREAVKTEAMIDALKIGSVYEILGRRYKIYHFISPFPYKIGKQIFNRLGIDGDSYISNIVGYKPRNTNTFGMKTLADLKLIIHSLMQTAEDFTNKADNTMNLTISAKDANKLYKAACNGWKERLFQKWGDDILDGKDIVVEKSFYHSMKAACNDIQLKILNEVFGADDQHEFPVNTVLFTKDGRDFGNAIVIGHQVNDYPILKTDYGNVIKGYSNKEIRNHFWVDFDIYTQEQITSRPPHKNAV